MKIVLYILLGFAILLGGFFVWFFLFFYKLPPLNIPQGSSDAQKIALIDEWFTTLQKENKFNGVVFFAKDGEALLAKGYGFTNYTKEETLTENSSLRLASVSKQFTAAGIMRLKEKGMLNYDDLVSTYIENFPYKDVSIRNLLNQTSGIPDIYMELAKRKKKEIDLLTNEIAVELIVTEKRKAESGPNEEFQYSNTNYIILARLIEILSGLSFEEFMRVELFEPLGMENTRVWNLLSEEATFDHKADDFKNFNGRASQLKPSFIDGVAGDGAVFCSAKDMLIWDSFWYENPFIGQASLEEAFKKPQLNDGKTSNYGFGWVLTKEGMWHNGAWLGARTIISRDTANKTCWVVLDNSSNVFFDEIIEEFRSANIDL
ncbi:MAG: serine hydrolase domain-containing protein [Bacteroidota bacterium]